MAEQLAFEDRNEAGVDKGDAEPSFLVDIDGFEGPLDLLLELARRQKVDLHKISILALAEQYLVFIEAARKLRLELAADYLVMAAWLAYLKSRLLLPAPPKGEEPLAADLAAALAARLRRLEAIRAAAEKLINRPRMGRELFPNGAPEGVTVLRRPQFKATLFDLLSAYSRSRQSQAMARVTMAKRTVWSIPEAREALNRLVGAIGDWGIMDDWLAEYFSTPELRRTIRASCFSASLELVREGKLEIRQDRHFAPIWVRGRRQDADQVELKIHIS